MVNRQSVHCVGQRTACRSAHARAGHGDRGTHEHPDV